MCSDSWRQAPETVRRIQMTVCSLSTWSRTGLMMFQIFEQVRIFSGDQRFRRASRAFAIADHLTRLPHMFIWSFQELVMVIILTFSWSLSFLVAFTTQLMAPSKQVRFTSGGGLHCGSGFDFQLSARSGCLIDIQASGGIERKARVTRRRGAHRLVGKFLATATNSPSTVYAL